MRIDRSRGRRRLATIGFAVAVGLFVAACGGGGQSAATDAGSTNTTLSIAQPGVLPNLDPINADNVTVDSVDVAMYEPLVDYDAQGDLVGRLASKWAVAPDGRSITFTLRSGATFHDGNPVTATDVAFTFNRIKTLGIGIAESLGLYAGVTVVNAHTVTIRLTQPSSLFLGYLSQVYILNSKLVRAHLGSDEGQAWLATHDAGSGPYELVSYQPNQEVILKKYPRFNGVIPAHTADTVTIELIQQAQTIANDLLSGEIDVTRGITGPAIAQVEKNPKFKLTYPTALKMLYVWFNTRQGPTANKLVREAIRDAYDYAGQIKTIEGGLGTPAAGVVPTEMKCVAKLPEATQNLSAARRLLQEAHVGKLTLTLQYQTFAPEFEETAVAMQSDLKQLGITLNLQTVTYPNWLQELKSVKTTPELAMSWYNPPTPDVGSVLSTVFSGSTVGSGENFGQYSNAEVNRLLAQAVPSANAALRCSDYEQIERILDSDSATMPVVDESNTTPVVASAGIGGTDTNHPGHVGLVPQLLTVG